MHHPTRRHSKEGAGDMNTHSRDCVLRVAWIASPVEVCCAAGRWTRSRAATGSEVTLPTDRPHTQKEERGTRQHRYVDQINSYVFVHSYRVLAVCLHSFLVGIGTDQKKSEPPRARQSYSPTVQPYNPNQQRHGQRGHDEGGTRAGGIRACMDGGKMRACNCCSLPLTVRPSVPPLASSSSSSSWWC